MASILPAHAAPNSSSPHSTGEREGSQTAPPSRGTPRGSRHGIPTSPSDQGPCGFRIGAGAASLACYGPAQEPHVSATGNGIREGAVYRPEEMSAQAIEMMNSLDLPSFDDHPFVAPKPLDQRRVAIISSAGLHRRGDRPFGWAARDYRTIPIQERALVMSHVAVDFDRTGFEQDLNTIFPIERLEELADAGVIGSV